MAKDIISTEELFGSVPEIITTEQLFGKPRSFWGKLTDPLANIGEPLQEMRMIPLRLAAQGVKAFQGKQVTGKDVANIIGSPYTDRGQGYPVLSDVVASPESPEGRYAAKTGKYGAKIALKAGAYLVDPFLDPLTYALGHLISVGGKAAISGVKAVAGKTVGKTLTMAEVETLEGLGKQAPSWWRKFTPKDKNAIIGAIQKDSKVTVAVRIRGTQTPIPAVPVVPEPIITPPAVPTPQPAGIIPAVPAKNIDISGAMKVQRPLMTAQDRVIVQEMERKLGKKTADRILKMPSAMVGKADRQMLKTKGFDWGRVKIISDEEAKKLAPMGISAELQPLAQETQFIRLGTKLEKSSGTAKQRGYNTIPDKVGYEKVYKPYGEQGAGYYYQATQPLPVEGLGKEQWRTEIQLPKDIDVVSGVSSTSPIQSNQGKVLGILNDPQKPFVLYRGGLTENTYSGGIFLTGNPTYAESVQGIKPNAFSATIKNPKIVTYYDTSVLSKTKLKVAKKQGYDSIVGLNIEPDTKRANIGEVVVFDKNQLKSYARFPQPLAGKYSGPDELVKQFGYSKPEAEAIMKLQNSGAKFEDVGGGGYILPKTYKITTPSGVVQYAKNAKELNQLAEQVKPAGFDYGRVKILSKEEADKLVAKGVQFQTGTAALGRLNPETFPEGVKPVLKEAIGMRPEVTPPMSDSTIRGMAASLKSRPLTEAILNKPEGQLAAEVMSQRAELTKNILALPSKSLKDLGDDIPAVMQKAAEYARPGTEVGRALRMRKVDPEINNQIWATFTNRINTIRKDPTIDPNLKRTVIEGLTKIRKMQTDPTVNPTLANKIYYAWLNAILSNPMTHARNNVGNITFAADKVLEMIPRVPLDVARSAIKGQKRTSWWGEIPAMVRGALSREKLPEEILRLAKGTKIEGGAPIAGALGKGISVPVKALQLEDDIFKSLIGRTELYRLRFLAGKGKFLGGKDVLQQTVADEMLYRTFQNDPSVLAQGIMSLRNKVPGVRYVIPFIKTPSNLVNVAIERSPLQAINILYKAIGKKYVGNQAMVSQDLARLATGSTIATWVAYQYKKGNITGSAPRTAAERDAFYRQGKKPNSIKVGDTWIPIGNFDPFGGVVTLITNTIDRWEQAGKKEDDPSVVDRAMNIVYGMGQLVSTRTYLSGIVNLATAVGDPERYADQIAKNQVASVVPGALKFWADLVDDNYRETNNQLAAITNKIPYLSKRLPEKVSYLGEPATGRRLGAINAGKVKTSEFENRIANIMIGGISKKLGDQKLTPDQIRWIYQTSGPQIKQIIMAIPPQQWDNLQPEIKEKIVDNVVGGMRNEARGQLRGSMTTQNIITTEQLFGQ